MRTLGEYLENVDLEVDVSSLIDPRVDEIESTICTLPIVYKYYPADRRSFFRNPQIRFTQQAELNDPFELSRRWQSESFVDARPFLMDKVQKGLSIIFGDAAFMSGRLQEELESKGIDLTPQQVDVLRQLLQTREGQALFDLARQACAASLVPMMDYVLKSVEERFQQRLEDLIARWGIFSISETPNNQQMWAHYASDGAGFVVGFDAQHPFFFSSAVPRKNLIRKVVYSDERVSNFWRNPYFLFLVKDSGWSYEREWRMMKELHECEEHRVVDGKDVFLANVPRAVIKEIYFGYAYDPTKIETDVNELSRDNWEPTLIRVRANRFAGRLESEPFTMRQR